MAYRRLARAWHPDLHRGDPEAERRFKMIAEAHWVLADEGRRAAYDRFRRGDTAPQEQARARPKGSQPRRGPSLATLFGQLVGSFARGGGSAASAEGRGQDLTAEIRLPFLVAVRGGTQALTIKRESACDRCGGKGAEPGSPVATCPTCRGQGQIFLDQGTFSINRVCHACRGRGTLPRVACRRCHGAGVLAVERKISLAIPAGIESGTKLRIAGEGQPGLNGQPSGDLYVAVTVEEHPHWRRDGADIHSDVVIDLGQAILGATLEIETVDGVVSLKIPPGTQPETLFKLRGRGVRRGGVTEARGDHYVRVHVAIPKDLTDSAKQRFAKLAKELGWGD